MSLEFFGELTASQDEDRVLTYKLLTYGEEGRTSAGLVTVLQGGLSLPEDPNSLVVNEEHDTKRPIGRVSELIDTAEGITASVRLSDTQAGRDAYTGSSRMRV